MKKWKFLITLLMSFLFLTVAGATFGKNAPAPADIMKCSVCHQTEVITLAYNTAPEHLPVDLTTPIDVRTITKNSELFKEDTPLKALAQKTDARTLSGATLTTGIAPQNALNPATHHRMVLTKFLDQPIGENSFNTIKTASLHTGFLDSTSYQIE